MGDLHSCVLPIQFLSASHIARLLRLLPPNTCHSSLLRRPRRAWLPEQTTGTDAELKASIAALHLRSALHLPLRANAFADWDENPKTRKLAADGQDACPPSAVSCAPDAAPHLADASLHCCPIGYRCFVHAPAADSGAKE